MALQQRRRVCNLPHMECTTAKTTPLDIFQDLRYQAWGLQVETYYLLYFRYLLILYFTVLTYFMYLLMSKSEEKVQLLSQQLPNQISHWLMLREYQADKHLPNNYGQFTVVRLVPQNRSQLHHQTNSLSPMAILMLSKHDCIVLTQCNCWNFVKDKDPLTFSSAFILLIQIEWFLCSSQGMIKYTRSQYFFYKT